MISLADDILVEWCTCRNISLPDDIIARWYPWQMISLQDDILAGWYHCRMISLPNEILARWYPCRTISAAKFCKVKTSFKSFKIQLQTQTSAKYNVSELYVEWWEEERIKPPVFFPPRPPSPSIPCKKTHHCSLERYFLTFSFHFQDIFQPLSFPFQDISSPLSFPSVESPYSAPPESFPFVSETFSLINLISEGVDNKILCWWLCPIHIVRLFDFPFVWLSVDKLVNYKPLSRTLRSLKTSRCDGIPV